MSYLPGQFIATTSGAVCEEHPDLPAVIQMVGETDSWGYELIQMCQACYDAAVDYQMDHPNGDDCDCDWCKAEAVPCLPMRDSSEGSNGPVYRVCGPCRRKERDLQEVEYRQLRDEIDHNHAEDEFYRNQV